MSTPEAISRDYKPSLRVDDISSSLTGHGRVGVERAGLAEADGDDIAHNLLDGILPLSQASWCSDIHGGV